MVRLIQSPGYRQLWGDRFALTKTGERRLENNMTGFKLATSVGGVSTGERGDRTSRSPALSPVAAVPTASAIVITFPVALTRRMGLQYCRALRITCQIPRHARN
jgi:hypothetical protein